MKEQERLEVIKRILDNNYSFLSKMIERKTLSNQRKEMFFYLGKIYDIIEVSIMDDIEIENDKIYTKNRTMLDRWYKKQIEKVFAQRYELMCQIFDENIIPPKLKIRTMKTRWGVYNKANHSITLNSHLIEYDIEKLDRILSDCISKFKKVKYVQDISGFVVDKNEVTTEVMDTLNDKLAFARKNVNKNRK